MMKIRRTLLRASRRGRQRGQGMVEYALLLSLIAMAAIGVIATLGPVIAKITKEVYTSVSPETPEYFEPEKSTPLPPQSVVLNGEIYTLAYVPMFASETLN